MKTNGMVAVCVKGANKRTRRVEVEARLEGGLAVHRLVGRDYKPDPYGVWVVTHVESGLQVCHHKGQRGALRRQRALLGLADWSLDLKAILASEAHKAAVYKVIDEVE